MKNKKILLMLGIMFMIFAITNIFAEIQFVQTRENKGNGTISNRIVLVYTKGEIGIADDYVTGSNPFEFYILYNIYPKKFNIDNPNFKVDYCSLKIQVWRKLESSINNTPVTILETNYTDIDDDIFNKKYFFQLYNDDEVFFEERCHFQNQSYADLYLPAEAQVVTPTWECKECQWYLWSLQEGDVLKAEALGHNVVTVSDYIKKLVLLNFEIILALFWISLIIFIFVAIGLIFIGVYWLYQFLNHLMK